jgi:D-alanine transaminase
MTRIVYVNGEFVPEDQAKVSVFDRAFLMADGVYEVTSVLDGKLVDFAGHLVRLDRSLSELRMSNPHDADTWLAIHRDLVARNAMAQGLVYLQVTRGAPGDRDFVWPDPATCPATVVMFTQTKPALADNPDAARGWSVVSVEDLRWRRRDIKTVQLLYPSLAKMTAKQAGADDAWLVEDGFVTEGTSNNAYIVKGNAIITRPLSNDILHGITRTAVLRLAVETQIEIVERPFTIAEAQAADEAFVTSASSFVMPVVKVDDVALGDGQPGAVTRRLRAIYIEEMRRAAV